MNRYTGGCKNAYRGPGMGTKRKITEHARMQNYNPPTTTFTTGKVNRSIETVTSYNGMKLPMDATTASCLYRTSYTTQHNQTVPATAHENVGSAVFRYELDVSYRSQAVNIAAKRKTTQAHRMYRTTSIWHLPYHTTQRRCWKTSQPIM